MSNCCKTIKFILPLWLNNFPAKVYCKIWKHSQALSIAFQAASLKNIFFSVKLCNFCSKLHLSKVQETIFSNDPGIKQKYAWYLMCKVTSPSLKKPSNIRICWISACYHPAFWGQWDGWGFQSVRKILT